MSPVIECPAQDFAIEAADVHSKSSVEHASGVWFCAVCVHRCLFLFQRERAGTQACVPVFSVGKGIYVCLHGGTHLSIEFWVWTCTGRETHPSQHGESRGGCPGLSPSSVQIPRDLQNCSCEFCPILSLSGDELGVSETGFILIPSSQVLAQRHT